MSNPPLSEPSSGRPWRFRCAGALGAALLCAITPELGAQRRPPTRPGPLFGGSDEPPPKRPDAPIDPLLPTGAVIASGRLRPAIAGQSAFCSLRGSVCVHGTGGVGGSTALAALSALERAHERLVAVLHLPAPLPDTEGGSDALDWYLEPGSAGSVDVELDPVRAAGEDRAAAFCSSGTAGSPRLLERAATLCVAEAIAARLDASETPHARRAYAEHLWLEVGQPTARDAEALDDVQAHPERAIGRRDRSAWSEGGALLFEYLDSALGRGDPWVLPTALIALGAGATRADAWQWRNEPDGFDVLRKTFDDLPSRMASMMGCFAVSRAFAGDRDDGAHLPRFAWAGALGRVRFDWSLPFSTLPRRVASPRPVEPTGA